MSGKFTPPNVQVSMVEGLPGSGKSLMLTEKALEYIKLRRPVYTNLPLRFRVMQRWLYKRGGPAFAKLSQPLTKEHFLAFCERQHQYALFIAELKLRGIASARVHASMFREKHGPNITSGPGANWIPAFAVIMIDECHHWFSAKDQMTRGEGRGESPHLLAYLTMHRHHCHDLWFATQDKMQVSVTVRRLAAEYWLVRDIAKEPLWMGLHFGMLGWKMLEYRRFNHFDYDKDNAEKCKPIESFWVAPWLPSRKWIFRLYESHTHAGSMRDLRAQLEMARIDAGVADLAWIEPPPMDRKQMKYLGVGVAAAVLGGLAGYMIAKPPHLLSDSVLAAKSPDAAPPVAAPVSIPPGPSWKITGTVRGAAYVGRQRVELGGVFDGYSLAVVGGDGSTRWIRVSDGLRFEAARGGAPALVAGQGGPTVGGTGARRTNPPVDS